MSNQPIVRAATPDDQAALQEVAIESGLFAPGELDVLNGMLADYFGGSMPDHDWLALELAGRVIGAAYVAPEVMTEGTSNLYFIAVRSTHQGAGSGGVLLEAVEALLRQRGQHILIVETSGLDNFELTRQFYRKHGFVEEARIRDFYRAGDDKVVFWKSLAAR